jgi:hypothetical protein
MPTKFLAILLVALLLIAVASVFLGGQQSTWMGLREQCGRPQVDVPPCPTPSPR